MHLSCLTKLKDIDALAALNEGKAKDIDLLVKVLNVFERDEFQYELRIKDVSN